MMSVPNTNRFAGLSHNAKLDKTLDKIENQIATAQSDKDLVQAIGLLDPLPKPVKFKPSTIKTVFTYGAYLLSAAAVATFFTSTPTETSVLLLAVAGLFYLSRNMSNASETDRLLHLSEHIHYRSRLFDYGLQASDPATLPDFKGLYRQFHIFQYGSYNNRIHLLLSGHYEGTDHSFSYSYFHITYSNDNHVSHSRTHVKPHDRCGFIVPFGFAKNLRISDNALKLFKPTWNSGSAEFNARFAVEAHDDMATAKFLKPALLKEIEAAGNMLSYIDLEFKASGELCFSFDDTSTLAGMRRTGLHDPAAFKQEILEHNHMASLDAALEFLHRLMKYSDNNFDQSTITQTNTNLKTGSTA